jgi:ribosome-binding factor A
METKRQKQIGELLRRQFSLVLMEEGTYMFEKALVTVTRVSVAPDLQAAKIYLSVFNTDNKQNIMLALEENSFQLRHALAAKVGKQLRRVPQIQFYLDESLDEVFRMDELFAKLRADNQMGSEEE